MIVNDRHDGRNTPFEGVRELVLRRLPRGARISSARAVVRPDDRLEDLVFDGESWGATHSQVDGTATFPGWAEVDFHARRTLVGVDGSDLGGTSLQVDPGGGVWVDVNQRGALGDSDAFELAASAGGDFPLPRLTVRRFKLTAAAVGDPTPAVTRVRISSVPSNVRLAFGGQPPFWTHPGELVRVTSTPDFAEVLQAFLEEAEVENGFYLLPVTLASDTIARLEVRFEFDVEVSESVLPEGLDRVSLRFDHGSVALKAENPLRLALPSGTRVRSTAGRAVGAFSASRVVVGPTGKVDGSASVEVSPSVSQAQRLDLAEAVEADAVDLLVAAVDRTVRLELNLVDDTDGKPGSASLLASPIALQLDRASAGKPTWLSAPLASELTLPASGDAKTWLVVQSLEGAARWSARPSAAGEAGLQETRDGALSWRRAANGAGPASALFRLRHSPRTFRMPLEIAVGEDAAARRVSLRRFDAAETVDLALDFPELASAVNDYLAETVLPCPETEHIANGSFERWTGLADGSTTIPAFFASMEVEMPAEWSLTSGRVVHDEGGGARLGYDQGEPGAVATGLSQVVPVSGGCAYELSFFARAVVVDALAELFWLDGEGGHLATGTLLVRASDNELAFYRLRLDAPAAATQAEVRFTVHEGEVGLTGVSLRATAEALLNGDFAVREATDLAGWQARPEGAPQPESLVQTVSVDGAGFFALEVDGLPDAPPVGAEVVLRFFRDDEAPTGEATRLVLAAGATESLAASGTVPADAAAAEVEILPAEATGMLRRVGLRFPELNEVPLEFVAEAPGQLRVEDLALTWEPVETPPPPLPAGGLAAPTPPGFTPGELADCECHCPCCGGKTTLKKTTGVVTEAGRAALLGACRTCGEKVVRFGGPPRPDAVRLSSVRAPEVRAAEKEAPHEDSRASSAPGLTAVFGIGAKRVAQLEKLGITSLADLAKADPRGLESLPAVSAVLAERFVRDAASILEGSQSTDQAPL